jgi:uncharacterized protein YqjF (DUF2071 family)
VNADSAAECPFTVRRALMWQSWESLTFLHWRYSPDAVQHLLPPGLTVEEYDGTAWVGLVPFAMTVSLPHVPAPPWLGRFAETNVRTYVRDVEGRPGVWFFSLDAARLAAVAVARTALGLPYFWSSMSVRRHSDVVEYRTASRRWPRPNAESTLTVRAGDAYAPDELTDFDHFLTARWRVFAHARNELRYVEAEHPPWPLRRCEVLTARDSLVVAAGLPAPVGDPVAHYSDGVRVRLGWPKRVSAGPGR